ncbi:hypothetical protein [Streptomyces sp. NPDC059003]
MDQLPVLVQLWQLETVSEKNWQPSNTLFQQQSPASAVSSVAGSS